MVDYVKPDGRKVMRTIADYRQLNDALFHAGLDSGSSSEWEDTPNRLHFYVVDLRQGRQGGILAYTLAVKSLDGAGPQKRGAALGRPGRARRPAGRTLRSRLHAEKHGASRRNGSRGASRRTPAPSLNSDVYRLSVSVEGKGVDGPAPQLPWPPSSPANRDRSRSMCPRTPGARPRRR